MRCGKSNKINFAFCAAGDTGDSVLNVKYSYFI
jgi:hypothetical protein